MGWYLYWKYKISVTDGQCMAGLKMEEIVKWSDNNLEGPVILLEWQCSNMLNLRLHVNNGFTEVEGFVSVY